MFVRFDVFFDQKEIELKLRPAEDHENGAISKLTKQEVLKKVADEWIECNKIFGLSWSSVDNDKRRQATFQVLKDDVDEIYQQLLYNGFGSPASRTVVIILSVLVRTNDNKYCEGFVTERHELDNSNRKAQDLVDCLKSLQSQLTVHEVMANVRNKGKASLDSVFQVITAGMIAMNGLAMDDPVIVVASMFIAPLMDVINMVTFAIRVRSRRDIVMGLKTFFFYIVIMMILAFVFSKPMQEWAKMLSIHMYGEEPSAYPTRQMTNRGHHLSLIGVAVLAICSTLSSYSSMLNGYNFNVHIGNAISLSLVPPVMNCGMLLVFGIDISAYLGGAHINSTDPCLRAFALCDDASSDIFNSSISACASHSRQMGALLRANTLISHGPKLCRYPQDIFLQALVSLSITFLTTLIVIVLGLALIWLKKFTPSKLDKNHVSDFYKHDLDAYVQDSHRTIRPQSGFLNRMRTELLSRNFSQSDCDMAISLAQQTDHYQTIVTSSALNPAHTFTRMMSGDFNSPRRRRQFVRQMTENQRTIRNTFYAPTEDDGVIQYPTTTFRVETVPDKANLETTPLHVSESVGRFEISRLNEDIPDKVV